MPYRVERNSRTGQLVRHYPVFSMIVTIQGFYDKGTYDKLEIECANFAQLISQFYEVPINEEVLNFYKTFQGQDNGRHEVYELKFCFYTDSA